LSEKTAVEFTQVGKRITFSAGYIVGMAPFGMRVHVLPPASTDFGCAVVTQLGVVMVDQEFAEAYGRWQRALAEPETLSYIFNKVLPQGNAAEF
jgi:hypothetical protein